MVQNLYSLQAVENLIEKYIENGGEIITLEEGVLGYGKTLLIGDGLKSVVITEIPLNCWSSAHSIRMYNKLPKKYEMLMEKVEAMFN